MARQPRQAAKARASMAGPVKRPATISPNARASSTLSARSERPARAMGRGSVSNAGSRRISALPRELRLPARSEEHTSELQSLMRSSYAVFCLNKNSNNNHNIRPDPAIAQHYNNNTQD